MTWLRRATLVTIGASGVFGAYQASLKGKRILSPAPNAHSSLQPGLEGMTNDELALKYRAHISALQRRQEVNSGPIKSYSACTFAANSPIEDTYAILEMGSAPDAAQASATSLTSPDSSSATCPLEGGEGGEEGGFSRAWSSVLSAFGQSSSAVPAQDSGEKGGHDGKAYGFLFGVFDGHSGSACSAFVRDHLYRFILANQKREGGPLLTVDPFLDADDYFLDWCEDAGNLSGSCVNVVHVDGRQVSVANIGDCRAVIGRKITHANGSVEWRAVSLSEDHDLLTHMGERERLTREHPNEPDVLYHNRIKGHLQPTRTMGDGAYKRMSLFKKHGRYPSRHPEWSPPYVLAEPDITHHTLQLPASDPTSKGAKVEDSFLVLASDGLYQDMNDDDVVKAMLRYREVRRAARETPPATLQIEQKDALAMESSSWLVREALLQAAKRPYERQHGRPVFTPTPTAYLSALFNYPGKRRNVHDDITIVVVDFQAMDLPSSL